MMTIVVYDEVPLGGLTWAMRPNTTDWNTLNACGPEDEYGMEGTDVTGRLIFDLGAHAGGFTIWQANRGAKVVAVEPLTENCQMIAASAKLNGLSDSICIVEGAVSDGSDVYMRYDFDGDDFARHHAWIGNSYRDEAPEDVTFKQKKVQGWSLSQLIAEFGTPLVVKVDCEGGEWDVLADPRIGDIQILVGEWHPTEGHNRSDVFQLLESTHNVTVFGPADGPGGFRADRRA